MLNKPLPQYVTPTTAASVKEPFDGTDWIFEPAVGTKECGCLLQFRILHIGIWQRALVLIPPLDTLVSHCRCIGAAGLPSG